MNEGSKNTTIGKIYNYNESDKHHSDRRWLKYKITF